ncbi:hypothetical protein [Brevundimonas intermedia]|uniref:hypothetical protein n=1 Tax=Brevundimonas intermedia TaxID=74315 RepID=UPI003208369F
MLNQLASQVEIARLLPEGSEPYRLAQTFRNLPSLPDRFNSAFLDQGWVFVEFACSHDAAEHALSLKAAGASQDEIDQHLAARFLGLEPIKWQSLKTLGGGMADPDHPVRGSIVQRVFDAYGDGDYLVVVPLVLMLVDGFGVTVTGTKSMFADLAELDELFQSVESVAGHPSALKALLVHLRKGQRGYSEHPLTMPLRNGILHGTRLNYANTATAAKSINLLAAVVEWARDTAPEPKDEITKREWNMKFLSSNLTRLNPASPQQALELFQDALMRKRATDVVALINYHPVVTLLSEKLREWRELEAHEITIEPRTLWEVVGTNQTTEQWARREALLCVTINGGRRVCHEHTLIASRSAELSRLHLPSVWQIDLNILGAIRRALVAD